MPGTCVIGLQWGDEAKGKLVDLLTDQHDMVVRYQGGANAGHTVVAAGQTYKLSLIPSGILSPGVLCVVTGGVVVNPKSLLGEINQLTARGIPCGDNLVISDRAHVIFAGTLPKIAQWTLVSPAAKPSAPRSAALAPAIATKSAARSPSGLAISTARNFARGLTYRVGQEPFARWAERPRPRIAAGCRRDFEEYSAYAERLRPYVADTTALLLDAVESGKRLLFEVRAERPVSISTMALFPSLPAATARASACRAAPVCRGVGSRGPSAC